MSSSAVPGPLRRARRAVYAGTALALACAGALVTVTTPAHAADWVLASKTVAVTADNVQPSSASVLMAPDGSATAVWLDSTAAGYTIRYATRPAGGTWTTGGAPIVSSATNQADAPVMAIAPDGLVTVAWVQHGLDGSDLVYVADRPTGGSWSSPQSVSDPTQHAQQAQVATNADKSVVVAWTSTWTDTADKDRSQIQAAERLDGTRWADSSVKPVSTDDVFATHPRLAGGSHKFILGWTEEGDPTSTPDVVGSSQLAPFVNDWTQLTRHTVIGDGDSTASDVAMDEDGNASIAWVERGSGKSVVFGRYSAVGQNWSDAKRLSGAGFDAGHAVLSVAPTGELLASWSRNVSDTRHVETSWYVPLSNTWTEPKMLDTHVQTADGDADPIDGVVDSEGAPTLIVGANGSSQSFRSRVDNGTEVWDNIVNAQPAVPVSVSRDSGDDVSTVSQSTEDGSLVERIYDHTPPLPTLAALPTVASSLSAKPTWNATDVWSPIATHAVLLRSATWTGVFGAQSSKTYPGTTHTATYALGTGRTYCFSVATTDAADNVSAPTTERCTTTPVDERSTTASKGWTNKSASGFYRSTYRTSYNKGAKLTLTNVNAKTLQLLAATGPKNGKVTATFRGARLGTWNLASSRNAHRTITMMNRPTASTGTLVLTIASGDTRVRHGKRVIVTHHPVRIDGVTVLR